MRRWWLVLAGMLCVTGGARADTHFTLANQSGRTIAEVYASPSRSGAWGRRLNDAPLAAGTTAEFQPASPECRQDVLVEYEGGREEQSYKLDLCAAPRLVWGDRPPVSDDPSFEFTNGTGQPIVELYVALTGQLGTAFDLLITGPLPPGGRRWIALPPGHGCLVDVALLMADQTRQERSPVETCSVRDVTFR